MPRLSAEEFTQLVVSVCKLTTPHLDRLLTAAFAERKTRVQRPANPSGGTNKKPYPVAGA